VEKFTFVSKTRTAKGRNDDDDDDDDDVDDEDDEDDDDGERGGRHRCPMMISTI